MLTIFDIKVCKKLFKILSAYYFFCQQLHLNKNAATIAIHIQPHRQNNRA